MSWPNNLAASELLYNAKLERSSNGVKSNFLGRSGIGFQPVIYSVRQR